MQLKMVFYHMPEGFNDKQRTQNRILQNTNYTLQYDGRLYILVQLGPINQNRRIIKLLEELTENDFLNDSVKSQITLTDEDLQAFKSK
jgi:hypothetical protein